VLGIAIKNEFPEFFNEELLFGSIEDPVKLE
jgi:hypothetical protein